MSDGTECSVALNDVQASVTLDPDLSIEGYSLGFGALNGPVAEEESFAELIHPSHRLQFITWLAETMREHFVNLPVYQNLRLSFPRHALMGY